VKTGGDLTQDKVHYCLKVSWPQASHQRGSTGKVHWLRMFQYSHWH